MKPITKYQANDGSTWNTEVEAVKRDGEHAYIAAIMSKLKPRPDSCDFSNGNLGYVQHDPAAFSEVWALLLNETRMRMPEWCEKNAAKIAEPGGVDAAWFCRIMDDSGPLCNAWNRLCSFDAQAREYGQPYLRWHPTKATVQSEYVVGSAVAP